MLSDKSVELGRLIGQSAEYQAVKRANEALNEDKEVVAALQRMEQLRHEAEALMQAGSTPTPAIKRFQLREMLSERPFDWWLKAKLNRFHCRSPKRTPGLVARISSGM